MGDKFIKKNEILDFFSGFSKTNLWLHLADQSISSRFRGSYLGAWWLIISQLAFAGVAGTIWGIIFGLKLSDFVPYIAMSFAIWGFIYGIMMDACPSLIVSAGYLKQIPLPLSLFIIRNFVAHCFYLTIGIVVALGLSLYFKRPFPADFYWVFPGLILSCFSLFWISVVFSFLGARFRDFSHGVGNILQVMYVVTPVIYRPSYIIDHGYGLLVYLNPFAGFLELIRHPLVDGGPAAWQHYAMIGGIGAIAFIYSMILLSNWGRKVVYWL